MNLRTLLPQIQVMAGRALKGMNVNAGTLAQYVTYPKWVLGPANAPTNIAAGPTQGWQFAVGNLTYTEAALSPGVDRTQNLVIGVAWAPVAAEAGKTIEWQLDIGFEKAGKSLATIDYTATSGAVAVPATAAIYVHTAMAVAPADWAADPATDELHIRLSRNATANDPVNDPAIHHVAFIQQLVTGAT